MIFNLVHLRKSKHPTSLLSHNFTQTTNNNGVPFSEDRPVQNGNVPTGTITLVNAIMSVMQATKNGIVFVYLQDIICVHGPW